MAAIVLVRHGETEWSASHRHTSYTEMDLTPDGERAAHDLATALRSWSFGLVLASPRRRATRTAELAGLPVSRVDDDLTEWNYGRYEGLTTAEIREQRPGWYLWTDGCPDGESPAQVTDRMDRLVARLRQAVGSSNTDIAIVGHAHMFRALAARWTEQPITVGGRLRLDTATLSVLGYEREVPVIDRWNHRAQPNRAQPNPTQPHPDR